MTTIEAYQTFTVSHQEFNFIDEDKIIKYRFFGKGKKTLLMLLGGSMFKSDAYFKMLEELKSTYQLITIEYPKKLSKIEHITTCIKSLLNHLGIEKVFVLGASQGGGVSQAFCKQYKDNVEGLILYNSLTKTDQMNKQSSQVIDQVLEAIDQLKILREVMPLDIIKAALFDQIKDSLSNQNDIDFFELMISFYHEDDEQMQMLLIKDLLTNYEFNKLDFKYLDQKVLVLYGHDDDPFGGTEFIESLLDVLTNPILEYIDVNRFSLILDPLEFIKKIKSFVK